MRAIGVDPAWAESAGSRAAETAIVALDPDGRIFGAGWTVGVDETVSWIDQHAGASDTILFVDAPLVVNNSSGQRNCERAVGQRYGRWKVSANSTNSATPHRAGVALHSRLKGDGWRYDRDARAADKRSRLQ